MTETDFGKQYFSVFGAVKDSVSSNLADVCRREGINEALTMRIINTALLSVDQTASNAYLSLWNTVKNFFRE